MHEVGARADAILTVSERRARDIIRSLRSRPARSRGVRAVHNGVAPEYPPAPRPAPRQDDPYVGRFDPYKNVVGLVEVFARVRSRGGPDVRLRIVGPPDPRYPEAPRRRGRSGWRTRSTGAATRRAADLVAAYQQADVFALLSRYEGFGLPVLEAMACGTPVVCSRTARCRRSPATRPCWWSRTTRGRADALGAC